MNAINDIARIDIIKKKKKAAPKQTKKQNKIKAKP
jgi:hypothetical protein